MEVLFKEVYSAELGSFVFSSGIGYMQVWVSFLSFILSEKS